MSSEPPVQKGTLARLGPPIQEPAIVVYQAQRDAVASKTGGVIPIIEGEVIRVDMGQEGADETVIVLAIRASNFDEVAVMAAPMHGMRVVVLERRKAR